MPMKLSTRQIKPGIVLLEIAGRVSMGDDCTLLDSEVERHIQKNENRVIFDLAGVNHIDSAVIGQIVKCLSRLKRSGGALHLSGVHGMVEGVLENDAALSGPGHLPDRRRSRRGFCAQAVAAAASVA